MDSRKAASPGTADKEHSHDIATGGVSHEKSQADTTPNSHHRP
ncbi:hypothetical protein [Dyadobacter sp. 3J3]|nr:hypothetical protein [Dyadobacter sp. 3J3]